MAAYTIDHDVVLDMWAAGEPTEMIRRVVGTMYVSTIADIVIKARKRGDKRAVRRPRGNDAMRNAMTAAAERRARHRKAAKFKVAPDDLDRAIAEYTGPITKLPPAIHAGWRPSWA